MANNKKETEESVQANTPSSYSVEELMKTERFKGRRYLLAALEQGKKYTVEEVEGKLRVMAERKVV